MTSYQGTLTGANVMHPDNPQEVIAQIGFAILPVTVQGLTDGKLSGPSIPGGAAIDTAATTTALHPSLAAKLELKKVGHEWGSGAGTGEGQLHHAELFQVHISLKEGQDWWELPVIIRPFEYENLCQVLIGLDILRDCRFTYDGPGDSYKLDRVR